MVTAFLALVALPALPQQANTPLSQDQIMDLVKFGMSSADIAKKIADHGIDFELTDEYVKALRDAGAKDPVIQALERARPAPLTRDEVGKLVAAGVPSSRAAALVKQRGIDFQADEKFLRTLRLACADDTLIAAVREANAAAPATLVVVTSAEAEVSIDGAMQGHADAGGQLTIKAKRGRHDVKVSLAGKKGFEQNVTLAAGQNTRLEATLPDSAETTAANSRGNTICLLIESAPAYWQPISVAVRILQSSNLIQPNDWAAAISYDLNPKILSDFGRGPAMVNAALAALQTPGFNQANFNDAVSNTLQRMRNIKGSKVLILISSGLDTFSKLDDGSFYGAVKGSDTPVYAISIAGLLDPMTQASPNFVQAKNKLDHLANLTNGHSYFPRSESEFLSVYNDIGAALNAM